jgi:hypothetical protein
MPTVCFGESGEREAHPPSYGGAMPPKEALGARCPSLGRWIPLG